MMSVQFSTVVDQCTELKDHFYTHVIFFNTSFLIQLSSNGLRMQPKPKAVPLSSHKHSSLLLFHHNYSGSSVPNPHSSNTSPNSSPFKTQSLITLFIWSLCFTFAVAVSYRRKNSQTWILSQACNHHLAPLYLG